MTLLKNFFLLMELAQNVVSQLLELGVLFIGIPGVHNLRTWDFIPEDSALVIPNERTSGLIALGIALEGRLPCINVIGGPGVTHAIRGISIIAEESCPCAILICEKADNNMAHQLHDVSNQGLLEAAGIQVFSLRSSLKNDETWDVLRIFLKTAQVRPCALVIPTNMLTNRLEQQSPEAKNFVRYDRIKNSQLTSAERIVVDAARSFVNKDFSSKDFVISIEDFKDFAWDLQPFISSQVSVKVSVNSSEHESVWQICKSIGVDLGGEIGLKIRTQVTADNVLEIEHFSHRDFLCKIQNQLGGLWFSERNISDSVLHHPPQLVGFVADGARRSGSKAFLVVHSSWPLSSCLSGIAEGYQDQSGLCTFLFCRDESSPWEKCLRLLSSEIVVITEREWENRVKVVEESSRRFCRNILVLVKGSLTDDNLERLENMLQLPRPSQSVIVNVAKDLTRSKRPVILAGRGSFGAKEELKSLAKKISAKVFTTFSGKGAVDENDDIWAWCTLPPASPKEFDQFFNDVDCILIIGARLSELASAHYRINFGDRQVFLVDISCDAGGSSHYGALFIQSDANIFLEFLLEALEDLAPFLMNRLPSEEIFRPSPRNDVEKLFQAISKCFGQDIIYTTDSGNGTILGSEWLRVSCKGSVFSPTDYSCMGFSVPAAFGASFSRDVVVAIPGDGAFLMTGPQSFFSCKRPVICIVLCDGKYGMMADIQSNTGRPEKGVKLRHINLKHLAQAVNSEFFSICKVQDAVDVCKKAIACAKNGKKVLIEAKVTYSELSYFSKGVFSSKVVQPPSAPKTLWSERLMLEMKKISMRYHVFHIWKIWEECRKTFAASIFSEENGEMLTYEEADYKISSIYTALIMHGFKSGDSLALISQNSVNVILVHFAVAALHGVIVNVNTRLSAMEMKFVLQDSKSKWILCSSQYESLVKDAVSDLPLNGCLVLAGCCFLPNIKEIVPNYHEKDSIQLNLSQVDQNDPFQMYYTSGTTGTPKAVLLSHENVFLHCVAVVDEMHLCSSDRWAHISPMFHLVDAFAIYGISQVGGTHVFFPASIPPNAIVDYMKESKTTCCNVAASLGNFFVEFHQGKCMDTTLRVMSFGGSALDKKVVQELIQMFKCEIFMSYGMTECCGKITMSIVESAINGEEKLEKICTSGRPFKLIDVKVVDNTGKDIVGAPGEVLIRGPTLFNGYLKNNAATQESFWCGWFKTGDVAIMRDDGYLIVCDRKKDMILFNSENVYSLEVEQALMRHPSIVLASVYGVPDRISGELVKAVVQIRNGHQMDESSIKGHCSLHLADYKIPRIIVQIDKMPMTGSGKVAKSELRKFEHVADNTYSCTWIAVVVEKEHVNPVFFGQGREKHVAFDLTTCSDETEIARNLLSLARCLFALDCIIKRVDVFCKAPFFSSVSSLCRSIQTEWAGEIRSFEILNSDKRFMLDCCGIISEERNLKVKESGEVQALRLRKLGIPFPSQSWSCSTGSYLVTGGAGDIGKAVVDYLASKSCQKIIILSRNARAKQKHFSQIKCEMVFLDCDVCNAEMLEMNLIPFMADIRGIFHLAAEPCDFPLRSISDEEFMMSISSKVQGARNLDIVSRKSMKNLSCFVMFSSVVTLLEAPRISHIAFSNSCLDVIANERKSFGLPCSIFSFGNFKDLGMVHRMGSAVSQFWSLQGLEPISAEEAMLAMDAFLSLEISNAFFFQADWSRFSARPSETFSQLLPVSKKSSTTKVEEGLSRSQIIDTVIKIITDVAPQQSQNVSESSTFGELGIQSVGSIEIWQRLNKSFSRTFSATVVYDYPQVCLLADFLCKELLASSSSDNESSISALTRHIDVHQVVVSGVSCRFAKSWSPDALWCSFWGGTDEVSLVPPNRWNWQDVYSENPSESFKAVTKWGCFFEGIDLFDPLFFNISKREAFVMDPQQRMLLECSVEALENAFCPADSLSSPLRVDVYVGIQNSEYARRVEKCNDKQFLGTGGSLAIASGRISYFFNLVGSSLSIDTACSSSLVTFNYSERAISSGHADKAFSFGVACMAWPETTINFSLAGMLSPDGRCKSFDASANGYVRGEGCGAFFLERESDSRSSCALVKGTSVNQDGRSAGLTAPSGPSQEQLVQEALRRGNISYQDLSVIEAHGTGTALGDPIEMNALSRTVGLRRESPLIISCSKTNVGHCETAAGAVGLLKLVLCIRNNCVSKNLLFKNINPFIGSVMLESMSSTFPLENTSWQSTNRICSVSSFGFSGTNSHCILSDIEAKLTVESFSQLRVFGSSPESLKNQFAKISQFFIENHSASSVMAGAFAAKMKLTQSREFKFRSRKELVFLLEDDSSKEEFSSWNYKFDRSHFWLEPLSVEKVVKTTLYSTGTLINLDEKLRIFRVDFERLYDPQDHLVFGVPIMPGACHLSLVFEHMTAGLGFGSVHLNNIVIVEPVVADGKSPDLIYVYDLNTQNIDCRDPLQASKVFFRSKFKHTLKFDHFPGWKQDIKQHRPGKEIWGKCKKDEGVLWGPSFQWIQNFDLADDKGIFCLAAPSTFKFRDLRVPPELIDSMFQGSLMFLNDKIKRPFLAPFTIDEFYAEGNVDFQDRMECIIEKKVADESSTVMNVQLCQGSCEAKISIKEFRMISVKKEAFLRNMSKLDPPFGELYLYETKWVKDSSQAKLDNLSSWALVLEAPMKGKKLNGSWGAVCDSQNLNILEPRKFECAVYQTFSKTKSSLKELIAVMKALKPTVSTMVVTTIRAVKVGPWDLPVNPWATSLWSAVRCIMAETEPETCLVSLIDFESYGAKIPYAALQSHSFHIERAVRENGLFKSEIVRVEGSLGTQQRFELSYGANGTFQDLVFHRQSPVTTENANDVILHVHSSALNFRDVLIVLDMYPEKGNVPVGLELSGTVEKSDEEGTFPSGIDVFGLCNKSFVSTALTQIELIRKKPEVLSHEDAAALPLVMCTCLGSFDFMKQGSNSALIHAASGGVGVAAAMIGRASFGIRSIYGTAGSIKKKKFCLSWGFDQVLNSRSTDYYEDVLSGTGGRGVDFILNSLTSPGFVERSVACLSERGSFVELGQRDIWSEHDFLQVRPNGSYVVYVLERVWKTEPQKIGLMLDRISEQFEKGSYKPLPRVNYPLFKARQAFQHMFEARHIGKIVFQHPKSLSDFTNRRETVISGAYGGLGGILFGEVSKTSMKVVGIGRSTLNLTKKNYSVQSSFLQSNCSNFEDMHAARFFSMLGVSKAVVFHLAGVLRDGFFSRLSWSDDWKPVISVKVSGLQNLCRCFNPTSVLNFSSITSLTGFVGQANYGAANGFLDGFSDRHVSVTSINWGAWSEVGMFTRLDPRFQKGPTLRASDLEGLVPLALSGQTQFGIMNVNWAESGLNNEATRALRDASRKQSEAMVESKKKGSTLSVEAFVEQSVRRIAGLSPEDELDMKRSLREMGFDSMLAVEIRGCLMEEYKIQLPSTLLFDYPSAESIIQLIQKTVPRVDAKEKIEDIVVEEQPKEREKVKTSDSPIERQVKKGKKKAKGVKKKLKRIEEAIRSLTSKSFVSVEEKKTSVYPTLEGICIRISSFFSIDELGQSFKCNTDFISSNASEQRGFSSPSSERVSFACIMDDVDRFDASHFQMSRREAILTSPQQRLLLESSWQAFEDAHENPDDLSFPLDECLVAVGAGPDGYSEKFTEVELFQASGSLQASLSGRLSYFYNLSGPSITIDTACSSTHMAVDYTYNMFQSRCSAGLVAGVNLILSQKLWLDRSSLLSPSGRCRPFDAKADGYVRGEACGVIILKKKATERAKAKIVASFSAHSGTTDGFMVPSTSSQKNLLQRAKLEESSVYIPQGTSSISADAVELEAVSKCVRKNLILTSWKTIFGHSEMASGLVSVAAALSYFQDNFVAKHLNFQQLNPSITVESLKHVVIAQEMVSWKSSGLVTILGVGAAGSSSSFSLTPVFKEKRDECFPILIFKVSLSSLKLKQIAYDNFQIFAMQNGKKDYTRCRLAPKAFACFALFNAFPKNFLCLDSNETRNTSNCILVFKGDLEKVHDFNLSFKSLILQCPVRFKSPFHRISWLVTMLLEQYCVKLKYCISDRDFEAIRAASPVLKFRQDVKKPGKNVALVVGRSFERMSGAVRVLSRSNDKSFKPNYTLALFGTITNQVFPRIFDQKDYGKKRQ